MCEIGHKKTEKEDEISSDFGTSTKRHDVIFLEVIFSKLYEKKNIQQKTLKSMASLINLDNL